MPHDRLACRRLRCPFACGLLDARTGSVDPCCRVLHRAAVALSVGLWLAVPDTSGWPSKHTPPRTATLIYGAVTEPDPQTGDPGHIYLWLDPGNGVPRAYRIPYSRQLHRQLQAALNAIKHGQPMTVAHTTHGNTGHGHGSGNRQQGAWRIYPQPPPGLPPKTP